MNKKKDIAIIGMNGRFPMANNIEEFWGNLVNGMDCLTRSQPKNELEKRTEYKTVYSRGILNNIELFDASFFGFSPREAELLDPQHRLFLECVWEVIESAGYNLDTYQGAISVFASCAPSTYLNDKNVGECSPIEKLTTFIANGPDFFATRVSYKLNLKGESVVVQTACSSSLTAVHMACQSLLNGSSDMAVVGGANLVLPQEEGYEYQEGTIYSPDGFCKPFDYEAQGTVEGNGIGVVLLKRLDEALEDGDYVYAIIKGSVINNDGSNKVGYTAPSVEGQAEVIATALAVTQIPAHTIGYIETHGTGTQLGDSIEIEALKKSFQLFTDKKGICALGSVKSNIGHTIRAAGIIGLIKTILIIRYGIIPPIVHFKNTDPQVNLENTPFFINSKSIPWGNPSEIKRAGVSSFGFGGTNVHLILEEPPKRSSGDKSSPPYLVTLSARSEKDLKNVKKLIRNYCEKNKDISLADFTFTLNTGRKNFCYRWAKVFETMEDLILLLSKEAIEDNSSFAEKNLLSFDETNYENMGRDVLEEIGRRWLLGEFNDWNKFYKGQKRLKVPLPTYPFEKKKYWIHENNEFEDTKSEKPTYSKQAENLFASKGKKKSCTNSDDINEIVEEAFKMVTGIEELDINQDIYELGLDSLSFAEVLDYCDQKIGIEISWIQAFKSLTPKLFSEMCKSLYEEKCKTQQEILDGIYAYDILVDGELATITIEKADFLKHGLPKGATNFRKAD